MSHTEDPGWQYLKEPMDKALAHQASKKYDSKKSVWVPDPEEMYIAGEITATKGDMCTVKTANGKEIQIKKDDCQSQNPPKFEKTEDMANLTFLNDASVLWNLKARYYVLMIYTYSGLFCVVINPYKRLPIYTDSVCKMFIGKRRNEMPPHLFAASDEAYRNMMEDRENQSMLITGESGAGKTENTKKVIAYFAVVGASQAKKKPAGDKKEATLEDQIVQTNPVLEAFGNAKTVRNNNSSRFGKFIRIHFNLAGKLAGGDIEHYLLEKSRVVKQAPGERCYHIFYQIMSGQVKGLREKLCLEPDVTKYTSVSQAEITIAGMDDAEEMRLTDEAFDIMGYTADEKLDLFKNCSSMMHMGEMKFKQRPREEQAEPDGNEENILACKMWGVSEEDFTKALIKPRVKVGTEWVNKGQNLDQVNWAVMALSKAIYARQFKWIVERCNKTLDAKEFKREQFIGVLDIAGFEIFDFNSFEQLWINFVNERLQQFFNHHMFVLEQEEYQREGIHWEFIDFGLDLQTCIELIEKPLGIISMLDEECMVPKGTDLTFAQKLNEQHLGKHPNLQKPKPPKGKQAEAHFAVAHYAGLVRYNVKQWLEKNKDPLNDTAVSVLKTAKDNKMMLDIWEDYKTQEDIAKMGKQAGGKKKGKSSAFMTVSMVYRESLNNLMGMLHTTHPHFIRCIIPNEQKRSAFIESPLVLNQLTCNGVLEGIRICRKGFPNRLIYPDFKQRYAILAAKEASDKDPKKAGDAMLKSLIKSGAIKDEEAKLGHTKIFFKAGILAHLEDMRDEMLSKIITKFQCACRSYLGKCEYKRRLDQRIGSLVIQRNLRAWCTVRSWGWYKLFQMVKPLLKGDKRAEEMESLEKKAKEMEEAFLKEEKLRKELEEQSAKLVQEKNGLFQQLQAEKDNLAESEERGAKLLAQKTDLERQIGDTSDRLHDQEERNSQVNKAKKKVEQDLEQTKKNVQDLEMTCKKQEQEKQSKDHQIRSLQDEMAQQDELISKVNKEKKHQEEVNRKLTEDLQAEEDKVNHLNKVKAKLEQTLDELEDNLERERRQRQDVDKGKRKVEGDLKVANENIDELSRQKMDMENNIKKKDAEIAAMAGRLEDEQSLVAKLQRQIKELQARIQELEEELEAERQSRSKAEKGKSDLQRELEELSDRLDEAGGATQAQIEVNKKREMEMAKLRRDLEEANMNHETIMGNMRKKHNDAIAELGEQLDQLQKSKNRMEKDKAMLQREVEDLHSAVDHEGKSKQSAEKLCKQVEIQLTEAQAKCDEQARQLSDYTSLKGRLQGEAGDLTRQLEDAESQINALNRIKQQLNSQIEEFKRQLEDETREKHGIKSQLGNYQHECDQLREQLDEEGEAKTELQRMLSKANAEAQQWRAKYEGEGVNRGEELEEAKRKLQARVNEMQDQMEAANQRVSSLEKTRQRLQAELEDAQVDADRANSWAQSLEKKQKGFDKITEEWKKKCDSVAAELDASQRDCRNLSTEVFKLKNAYDEAQEATEAVRRENKALSQEIKDLADQLGEGGKSVHELQKIRRRLELEKEELQQALDEAEAALEAEESKVMRSQLEVSQIRQEIEKRIHEKEEEFENTRKNHQRALDSMQASLEGEAKGRAELMRMKKKLESDINELEIALDHANKANADAQKNIKRYHEQIRELQSQIEDEQRARDEVREHLNLAERRCSILQSEKDEMAINMDHADRARRQAELDSQEAKEHANDLAGQNASLNGAKRRLEGELQALHAELDDSLNELKASEERSKKAMMDAARLADELRQEQEHAQHVERARKALEQQIKEMQVRLDEAEAAALKGGKKMIAKLEQKVKEIETEMDGEQRRHQDTLKNLRSKERRVKELQFQVDEDKKSTERMHDLIEKLQGKIKTYKRQVEEAEQLAGNNLHKYRQLQHQLEGISNKSCDEEPQE